MPDRGSALTLLGLVCVAALHAQTFNKDIAPIVHEYCAPCHRPGEAGPFTLLEYSEVKKHASQIAAVTASRYMPPWKPEPGKGEFRGSRRLTDTQVRTIQEWVSNGAPEGEAKDRPVLPVFEAGWQLGKPDLVVTLERPYMLAASGSDVFRNFILRPAIDRKRYVRAVEIRPGNKKIVHHANLVIDRGRASRAREGEDGAPGFPGMDASVESRSFDPDSHFLFWKPGSPPSEEAEQPAWVIEPGTDLVLNVHLQPGGKVEPIQPSIGLYFTETPPRDMPMLVQLEHDGALDIPPGAKQFVITDTLRLPVDVDVLGVYPHAHYLGRDLQGYATLPDGSKRWLIHIRDWDIAWQAVYRYNKPLALPAGSVVTMRYTYDNSAGNPRNPNHPPARVRAGDRSADEMAHLWLQLLPRSGKGDPRMVVQEAVLRRRLEKYPSDFYAHFSLGALLQSNGALAEAITHYRSALRVRPGDAMARNALGTVLQTTGDLTLALKEFRAAVGAKPDYVDARYNLARVLLVQEQTNEAIEHLREVVRIDPADAVAISDLGAALQMTGRVQEGMSFLREAVRVRPDYFNGRYNLAQALAAAGAFTEARIQFDAALRLKPGDHDTTEALRRLDQATRSNRPN